MALELNQSNVDEALKEKKVTVLDFWALVAVNNIVWMKL